MSRSEEHAHRQTETHDVQPRGMSGGDHQPDAAPAGLARHNRPPVVTKTGQVDEDAMHGKQEGQAGGRPVVTRSIQEDAGVINNCSTLAEQAKQLALDLATSAGRLADREATFLLARKLRTLTKCKPEQLEAAVRVYCENTGRPVEGPAWGDFYIDFIVVWEKVRYGEGDGPLTWAKTRADEHPYPIPCSIKPPDQLCYDIASLAWHLSKLNGDKPFQLPRERLAELYGVSPMTIFRRVIVLERNGILNCVDANYSYSKRKAKDYKFAGPEPAQPPAHPSPEGENDDVLLAPPVGEPPPSPEPAGESSKVERTRRSAGRFANSQSAQAPFQSKYGEVWLSVEQHLAEKMCARRAAKDENELPANYWDVKKWQPYFSHQTRQAGRLLKRYDKDAIFHALKTREGQKVYSLAAPWFDALVKAEQERLDRQKTPALAPPAEAFPSMPTAPTGPRPAFVERPSLLAKLRGL